MPRALGLPRKPLPHKPYLSAHTSAPKALVCMCFGARMLHSDAARHARAVRAGRRAGHVISSTTCSCLVCLDLSTPYTLSSDANHQLVLRRNSPTTACPFRRCTGYQSLHSRPSKCAVCIMCMSSLPSSHTHSLHVAMVMGPGTCPSPCAETVQPACQKQVHTPPWQAWHVHCYCSD